MNFKDIFLRICYNLNINSTCCSKTVIIDSNKSNFIEEVMSNIKSNRGRTIKIKVY